MRRTRSVGLALDGFPPPSIFARTGAEGLMGAGGSTIALTWHLMRAAPTGRRGSSSRTAARPGWTISANP